MRSLLFGLIVALSCPTWASAQAGRLLADAKSGEKVTVVTTGGRHVKGRLLSDDGRDLVVRADGQPQRIASTEVARVDRHRNRFLFGPLIGLGAGLAVGLPIKQRFDNEGSNGDAMLAITVGAGVGMGILIDLFNGSTRTIYTRTAAATGLTVAPRRGGFAVTLRHVF